MKTEIVRVRNGTVKGPGDSLLKNLNICICKGETLGLFAPDNREKRLLTDLLCGKAAVSSGTFFYRGNIVEEGMKCVPRTAVVTQTAGVIENFTVWENMLVFRKKGKGGLFLKERFLKREAKEQLEEHGLELDVDSKLSALSLTERYIVEILKAHLLGAEIIVVDEFTFEASAGLVARFIRLLRRLEEEGVAFVITGCRFGRLNQFADRIAFLYKGSIVQVMENRLEQEPLINKMKERILSAGQTGLLKAGTAQGSCVCLEAAGADDVKSVRLCLVKGEVTVVLDVDGTGAEWIWQCEESDFRYGERMEDGYGAGTGYDGKKCRVLVLPEYRYLVNIFHSLTLTDNLCLKFNRKYSGAGWISRKFENFVRQSFFEWSGRKEDDPERATDHLTEQERVAVCLYRLKMQKPEVLFCKDPLSVTDAETGRLLAEKIVDIAAGGTAVCIFLCGRDCPADIGSRYYCLEDSKLREVDYEELKQL